MHLQISLKLSMESVQLSKPGLETGCPTVDTIFGARVEMALTAGTTPSALDPSILLAVDYWMSRLNSKQSIRQDGTNQLGHDRRILYPLSTMNGVVNGH